MKPLFYLAPCLALWAGAVHAQAVSFDDKLCKELQTETEQFLTRYEDKDYHLFDVDSPMMIIIDAALTGLDDDAKLRIRFPLADDFSYGCVRPTEELLASLKERGLPENLTAGQLIDFLLNIAKLDRSAPRWGLTDIPELDISKLTIEEFYGLLSNEARGTLAYNSIYAITLRKYWSAYDLSTPESRKKARRVMASWSFETGHPNEILKNHLDRLAAEQGLKLK